jgi:putative tryptophan/tyrosine transport system substrate-binding protein
MPRRTSALVITLTLAILVAPLAASTQPRAPLARIAFLGLSSVPPASALPLIVAAFQQGLRELGWVEGQNLAIEWRWAEGSLERFATLVEEMVRLPVEVLVVPNQITAQLAQKATTTIPIIIVAGGALANTGLSLAQPGGNITGFAGLNPALSTKRLELLTHVIPGLTCVAVVRWLAPATRELQAMEVAARALGVQLQLLAARNPLRSTRRLPRRSARGLAPWWCWGTGAPSFPTAPNSPIWPSNTGCRRASVGVRLSRRVGS